MNHESLVAQFLAGEKKAAKRWRKQQKRRIAS